MSKKSKRQNVTVATPVVAAELPAAADATVTETVAPVAADTPAAEVAEVAETQPATNSPAVAETPAPTLKYPREGGKCWQVWDAADKLVASGANPSVADLRAIATENNWNVSNASQEFYRWRKFRGRK